MARRIAGPRTTSLGHLAVGAALRSRAAGEDADAQQAITQLREEVESLRGEVASMQGRLGELDDLHNRLDFAERTLAQAKAKGALPGGQ